VRVSGVSATAGGSAEYVADAEHLVAPSTTGKQHALLGKRLWIGQQPLLEVARAGLHRTDVQHDALSHDPLPSRPPYGVPVFARFPRSC
jgi:hypothetical protein